MHNKPDTYHTIESPSKETLFKDRGSKFFGYAFPVVSEKEVKTHIEILKKQHHTARHWCYAWQLGKEYQKYRANDDGEPSNSAGMPIYGQLKAFNVTNILVVVVRYFGGTKLGVGGLINAYRSSASLALKNSEIIEKTINKEFLIQYEYPEMNTVMRIIKEERIHIINQQMGMNCQLTIAVREKEAKRVFSIFKHTHKVDIKKTTF